jgi:hypothetical protein
MLCRFHSLGGGDFDLGAEEAAVAVVDAVYR